MSPTHDITFTSRVGLILKVFNLENFERCSMRLSGCLDLAFQPLLKLRAGLGFFWNEPKKFRCVLGQD